MCSVLAVGGYPLVIAVYSPSARPHWAGAVFGDHHAGQVCGTGQFDVRGRMKSTA